MYIKNQILLIFLFGCRLYFLSGYNILKVKIEFITKINYIVYPCQIEYLFLGILWISKLPYLSRM